jgi:hypothetical protein
MVATTGFLTMVVSDTPGGKTKQEKKKKKKTFNFSVSWCD